MTYKVGDKIKFKSEKQRYTVRACNERFLVCTKPFNPKKTVFYTLVDLQEQIRGTHNYIFSPFDYAKIEDCQEALECLIHGSAKDPLDFSCSPSEMRISYRNRIKLDSEEK